MRHMNRTTRFLLAVLTVAVLSTLFLASCTRKVQGLPFEDAVQVAVAPFAQAFETTDLMAGYIPPESETVPPDTLTALDQAFRARISQPVMPDASLVACMASSQAELDDSPHSILDYWVATGRCAQADYVIVPQVLYWKEREGSAAGVTTPAGVVIDFNVVDVAEYGLASRVHYDETQVSLAENLLTLDKFVSRSGVWVTAQQLAEEGIDLAVKEFGL